MNYFLSLIFLLSIVTKLNAYNSYTVLDEQFKTSSDDFCGSFYESIKDDLSLNDVINFKNDRCKTYQDELLKHKTYIEKELTLPVYN